MDLENQTILITNFSDLKETEVSIENFFKIVLTKMVVNYYREYCYLYKSLGLEFDDICQELKLLILELCNKNNITQKIKKEEFGKYLYMACQWKLITLLTTGYKLQKRLSFVDMDDYQNLFTTTDFIEVLENLPNSERILQRFAGDSKDILVSIIQSICNINEQDILISYFYDRKKFVEIAKEYKVSKQYISQIYKSALVKLNNYFQTQLNNDDVITEGDINGQEGN